MKRSHFAEYCLLHGALLFQSVISSTLTQQKKTELESNQSLLASISLGVRCDAKKQPWMPADDVSIYQSSVMKTGLRTAVKNFCQAVHGKTIQKGSSITMVERVFRSYGLDPSSFGVGWFVYFEIENHGEKVTADATSCTKHLDMLYDTEYKCMGDVHDDTRGGYVISGNITYRAEGNDLMPNSKVAIGALGNATQSKLSLMQLNSGASMLSKYPSSQGQIITANIQPVRVHRHNDYSGYMEHNGGGQFPGITLYDALRVGAISVEADVCYDKSSNRLYVNHVCMPNGNWDGYGELKPMYLDLMQSQLDLLNTDGGHSKGIFQEKPEQSLVLLIDFKTGNIDTWYKVLEETQPLRDRGYLSYWDTKDENFVERPITLVISGYQNFMMNVVNRDMSNPNRTMFLDAPDKDSQSEYEECGFNKTNTYYTSKAYPKVGNPSESEVKDWVDAAHDAGIAKTRYWRIKDDKFQDLLDDGVDVVSYDNLVNVASLDKSALA